MKSIFSILCSVLIGIQVSNAQSISEWREENRTGVSAETGLMKSWPEAGPNLLWSNLKIPKGYSSVAFGDNHIYLTGNEGEDDILVALEHFSAGEISAVRSAPFRRCG